MTTLDPIRVQPVDGESLTELLQKYGERVRRLKSKSQAQISRDAWLDESYVSRLFSGERTNPSRDALVLLGAWGLELAVEEVDELLMAASYKPLVLPASIR
jgi:transcriptional regulator with XRE-family HTH domain